MKAVLLEEPGKFSLVDLDPPEEPRPGEALVRIKRIGVCGTDLHAFQGEETSPSLNIPGFSDTS